MKAGELEVCCLYFSLIFSKTNTNLHCFLPFIQNLTGNGRRSLFQSTPVRPHQSVPNMLPISPVSGVEMDPVYVSYLLFIVTIVLGLS